MNNIGRNSIKWKIVHSFIETGMLGSLDTIGLRIVPDNVLGGIGEKAKEETLASIGTELGTPSTWRPNPNSTPKRSKRSKVILFSSGEEKRRCLLVFRRQDIVNSEPMVESVRPELDGEIGTNKHSTDGIGNSKMTSFNRSILI